MEHGGWTYVFLRGGRKAWHHDQHKHGWLEVAHERGEHLECGVYRKLTAELTAEDRENWVSYYGARPTDGEWFDPSDWQDPSIVPAINVPEINAHVAAVFDAGCYRLRRAVVADDSAEIAKWAAVTNAMQDAWPDIVEPLLEAARAGKQLQK